MIVVLAIACHGIKKPVHAPYRVIIWFVEALFPKHIVQVPEDDANMLFIQLRSPSVRVFQPVLIRNAVNVCHKVMIDRCCRSA